jgi:hypothetical protein
VTVSGLVITLDADPDKAFEALTAIQLAGPFTLGDQFGPRVTAVLQAETPAEARQWHDWVTTLLGVVKVDVAIVHLDDAPKESSHDG